MAADTINRTLAVINTHTSPYEDTFVHQISPETVWPIWNKLSLNHH